ncbi:hypothetical protein LBMAG49_07020 [Planctomycetota bacterium]|nr:hypothetical protein LBMAG49_07020 [Planctomycetota bacterium]
MHFGQDESCAALLYVFAQTGKDMWHGWQVTFDECCTVCKQCAPGIDGEVPRDQR